MYFVVSVPPDREAGSRLGQPRAPAAGTSGPVALFSCSEAGRKKIEAIVGRTVSEDDLRKAIHGAIDKAASLAAKAIGNLRSATRSSTTRELLLEVFGTFPEAVPTWRAASAEWTDLGELVAWRLERAARILRYSKL